MCDISTIMVHIASRNRILFNSAEISVMDPMTMKKGVGFVGWEGNSLSYSSEAQIIPN